MCQDTFICALRLTRLLVTTCCVECVCVLCAWEREREGVLQRESLWQTATHCNTLQHISHITYEWGMSHMNASCRIRMRREWVLIRMSHGAHMNEWSHVWICHVTHECVRSHMNASCHVWISHVTYAWAMSHIHESCHMCSMCIICVCVCVGYDYWHIYIWACI